MCLFLGAQEGGNTAASACAKDFWEENQDFVTDGKRSLFFVEYVLEENKDFGK